MCNPPFYSSESELQGNMEKIRKPEKRHLPNSINTGQLHESVFSDGGEVGFIKKMIDESIQIGKKIRLILLLGKFFLILCLNCIFF
jgi:23S rRNA (adenine1618-N6)-methyltransferase